MGVVYVSVWECSCVHERKEDINVLLRGKERGRWGGGKRVQADSITLDSIVIQALKPWD